MAYTKIKNIKATVNKAIDYIIKKEKTHNGLYVFGYNVAPKTASIEFEFTEKLATDIVGDFKREDGNLAYHIIQSFDYKDIITPQEALEIGRKTVEELTGGKYEYVIGTHLDKTCIHNHIVFNAVSFKDYKRFNSVPKKTVAQLRNISDKFCKEKGLHIIESSKNDNSKSYYEWLMDKKGLSWKRTLKNIIDKNIINSKSFNEFLELMKKDNYEIKQGKHLAFKHKAQEKYIRSFRLGNNYTEEKIKERIVSKNKFKNVINAKYPKYNLPLNIMLMLKARKEAIKNIKDISNLIYQLEQTHNIKDMKDIKIKKGDLSLEANSLKTDLKEIEKDIKDKQEKQRNILIYNKYKIINDKYNKAINKKKFYNDKEAELTLFKSAETYILDNNLTNLNQLEMETEKELKNLQEKYIEKRSSLKENQTILDNITHIEKTISNISNQKTRTKEKEQEQTKKKRNILL